jgi:hypothetical protein
MERFFTAEYAWLWALALAAALFFPVRQLLWALYVRRAERDGVEDEARRLALRKRAAVTSALLCFVFSMFYAFNLLQGR